MRILIVGAGAIGGYFGGRLLQANRDVTFLVRERLILLSCKAYDLENAIESFAPAVGAGTIIVPLLNGMKHLDTLDARFGAGPVFGGQCVISTALDANGRILHLNNSHDLMFGERSGKHSERAKAILALMTGAIFDVRLSDNILQSMWEKWAFIAAAAGITCLLRATVGDIHAAGGTDAAKQIYEECAQMAADAGFPPSPATRQTSLTTLTTAGSPLTASMLRDIESRGRTEVDQILGDLLHRRKTPSATPSILAIAHLHVKAYEARRKRELNS